MLRVRAHARPTAQQVQHFRDEIAIMRRLLHPHICLYMACSLNPDALMIVTEYVPRGDLCALLASNDSLSLCLRMKMATDAALGMSWLHESRPRVLHRDLKSKNLLVDNAYAVKVADFGLSQILPDGVDGHDDKQMRGTPLWNAPEVLERNTFTEKADIYSFAICLWELLTRSQPFASYNVSSLEELRDIVCVRQQRPRVPPDTLPMLAELLALCWHADPSTRPPFVSIVPQLERVIVASAVRDQFLAELWYRAFGATDPVPWSRFLPTFLMQLQIGADIVRALCDENDPNHANMPAPARATVKCLRRLLCGPVLGSVQVHARIDASWRSVPTPNVSGGDSGDVVWLERYGASLDLFAPLPGPRVNAAQLLDELSHICESRWFHGHVSREDAHTRLQSAPLGTYLVRCSSSAGIGGWAVSYVRRGHSGALSVAHRRIRRGEHGFELEAPATAVGASAALSAMRRTFSFNQGDEADIGESLTSNVSGQVGAHASLVALIAAAAPVLGLTYACPGSPFDVFFFGADTAVDQGYDDSAENNALDERD
jgi:serine/threonine protein kinase